MPRIEAGTVAEHRDLRQAALLEAAADIARTDGVAAVTVGAVAERAGIARSTVYSYFNSGADIVADVIVDELTDMAADLAERVAPARDAEEAVHLWIRGALEYIADGRHALVRNAMSAELPPTRRQQIAGLHRELSRPLMHALAGVGHAEAARFAAQVGAVAEVCARRIEAGNDADAEIDAAESFIREGLGACITFPR